MLQSFSMENILLVNKPKGISSFDVIRRLRKKLGIRKMGHAGTLDPLAHGLMIIGINEGTKKLREYIGLPKTYIAKICFGQMTDSGDLEGKVLVKEVVPDFDKEFIKKELSQFVGEFEFEVPIYSAIKKDGKPLYDYARKGVGVEVPKKKMTIRDARLLEFGKDEIVVEWDVSSGTYIRTLAMEFAKRIGTIGVLVDLERVKIGEFDLQDAVEV